MHPHTDRPPLRHHAADAHWLVGTAIDAYCRRHSLTEPQLAAQLGLPLAQLGWLRLATRPRPDSATFAARIQRLAQASGCNANRLAEILAAIR